MKNYSKISKVSKSKKLEDKKNKDITEPTEKKLEEVKEECIKEGFVNCAKLNIRKEPDKKADIVAILEQNQKVCIEEDVGKEFFKISFKDKNEKEIKDVYCMKSFITLLFDPSEESK